MKIKPINQVDSKIYDYVVEDFSLIQKESQEVFVKKHCVERGLNRHYIDTVPSLPGIIKGAYSLDGNIYVYCDDGFIYKIENGNAIQVLEVEWCGLPPRLFHVVYQGKVVLLVIKNTGECVLYDNEVLSTFTIENARFSLNFAGRLFVATDNKIYYSQLFDYVDFSSGLYGGGSISIDYYAGEILGLFKMDNKIIVVTTKKIYSIVCFGDNVQFKLKEMASLEHDVLADSVKKLTKSIVFVSNNKVYSYANGSLSELSDTFDRLGYVSQGEFSSDRSRYYALVKKPDSQDRYVYSISVSDGYECFSLSDAYLFLDEGVILSIFANCYSFVEDNGANELTKKFKTIPIRFNTEKTKKIIEVELISKSSAKMIIESNGKVREYNVKEGYNAIKVLLTGQAFTFAFFSEDNEFKIKNMHCKYMIKGA